MLVNNLNDISAIYLQQVAESSVPGKPAERLGAVTAIPKSEQEAARERLLAKTAAKRAMKKEALDPVGQEDSDIDNDGDSDKTDKYLSNRRKAIGKAIKKEKMKESFSNWRQDLSEVMDDIEASKEIKEKKITNKIKINPEMKEAVEKLGGHLIEMVELEEVDLTEEIDIVTEYFYEQGLNEDGIDILIEELGIESFVDFVYEISEEYTLNEARTLTGKKKSPATGKERGVSLKAAPGKSTKSAVEKYGTTRKLSSSSSSTIRKKSIAVKKAVEKQPETKSSPSETKKGIAGRVGAALGTAFRKGMERHRAATSKLSKTKLAQTAGTVAGAVHGAGVVAHRLGKEAGKSKTGQKIKKSVGLTKEELELHEKAESEQQQKLFGLALSVKRGQTARSEVSDAVLKIVDSMSEKKIRDFAKTKHEGIPKKVEEDLQPTTPQQFSAQRQLAMAQKKLTTADQAALRMKKKEQPQEEFENEGENLTELNRAERETGINTKTGKPTAKGGMKDDKAFTSVKRMMRNMEGTPAGQRKKVPGKKPPTAGQYGAPQSPAQKIIARRAAAKRSQDNMSSRFD